MIAQNRNGHCFEQVEKNLPSCSICSSFFRSTRNLSSTHPGSLSIISSLLHCDSVSRLSVPLSPMNKFSLILAESTGTPSAIAYLLLCEEAENEAWLSGSLAPKFTPSTTVCTWPTPDRKKEGQTGISGNSARRVNADGRRSHASQAVQCLSFNGSIDTGATAKESFAHS